MPASSLILLQHTFAFVLVAAVGDLAVFAERDISRVKLKGLAVGCDALKTSIKKVKEEMVFKARETGELYVDCLGSLRPCRWPRSRMINLLGNQV